MDALLNVVFFGVGIFCAWAGSELFVKGAVGLSRGLKVPAGLIGLTVSAFATSSPECAVAVSSALRGVPQISLGDVIGSNVVNIALFLGIALLIGPIKVDRVQGFRDIVAALGTPLLLLVLIADGAISRLDAAILITVFLFWLHAVVAEALKARASSKQNNDGAFMSPWRIVLSLCLGIGLLVAAGNLFVLGAERLAHLFGIGTFAVGATIVAVSTGTPELATTIVARLRGHGDLGIGTILGSNIFNGLFIVATAGFILPYSVEIRSVIVGLIAMIVVTVSIIPFGQQMLSRLNGFFLLVLYALYLWILLFFQ